MAMQRVRLDVSPWTVVKVVLTLLAMLAVWQVRKVLVIGFVTLIVVAALSPLVKRLAGRSKTRVVASAVVVLGVVTFFGGTMYLLAAPLLEQFLNLVQGRLPRLMDQFSTWYQHQASPSQQVFNVQQLISVVNNYLQTYTSYVVWYVTSAIDLIVVATTVLVLAFYVLADGESLLRRCLAVVPREHRRDVRHAVEVTGDKLGQWLRGQFVLCAVMAVLVSLAGFLIGIPAFGAVGILAGIFEMIPYVGPVLTAATMVLMSATADEAPALKMGLAMIVYSVLQFIEGHVLVPKIMQRAIGLSPVLVILALLAGAELAGIVGVILAIPAAAVIEALIESWPTQGYGLGGHHDSPAPMPLDNPVLLPAHERQEAASAENPA